MKEVHQNHELYERLSEPYPNRECANAALDEFRNRVRALREELRIPEVLLVAAVHMLEGPDNEIKSTVGSLSLGNSGCAGDLVAIAYANFAVPEIKRAERLQRMAAGEPVESE